MLLCERELSIPPMAGDGNLIDHFERFIGTLLAPEESVSCSEAKKHAKKIGLRL